MDKLIYFTAIKIIGLKITDREIRFGCEISHVENYL